jgi:hypothetical protein
MCMCRHHMYTIVTASCPIVIRCARNYNYGNSIDIVDLPVYYIEPGISRSPVEEDAPSWIYIYICVIDIVRLLYREDFIYKCMVMGSSLLSELDTDDLIM